MRVQGYRIGKVNVLSRTSGGGLCLVGDAPKTGTWRWAVYVEKLAWPDRFISRAKRRVGQWHDYYWLPFGFKLIVSFQAWHKRAPSDPLPDYV